MDQPPEMPESKPKPVNAARVVFDNPRFVQLLDNEDLRKLAVSVWDTSLTRYQRELIIMYMFGLMVHADIDAEIELMARRVPISEGMGQPDGGAQIEELQENGDNHSGEYGDDGMGSDFIKPSTPDPEAVSIEGQTTKKSSRKRVVESDEEYQEGDKPPRKKPTARSKSDHGPQLGQTSIDPFPSLEWIIYVPDKAKPKRGSWKSFRELPDSVREELEAHFHSTYCTAGRTDKCKAWYRKVLKNANGLDRLRCLSNGVYGYYKNLPAYTHEPGLIERCCDTCTNTKKMCARMVTRHKKDKLGIFPLPAGKRAGVEWNELGFWVAQ